MMVMKGTLYSLKFDKLTDDEARKRFEKWLKQTGRDRLIDWSTLFVDQSDPKTTTVGATV